MICEKWNKPGGNTVTLDHHKLLSRSATFSSACSFVSQWLLISHLSFSDGVLWNGKVTVSGATWGATGESAISWPLG